jgi:hypothetical protein
MVGEIGTDETISEDITFSLYRMFFGRGYFQYRQEAINLLSLSQQGKKQHKVPLEGISDWAYISQAGFVDGAFHLKAAFKNGTEHVASQGDLIQLYLVDKNGKKIESVSTGIALYPNENDMEWGFMEYVFPKITNKNELIGMSVVAEGFANRNVLSGSFKTTFKLLEDAGNITIPAKKEIMLGKRKVNANSITISPLYLRVYYDGFTGMDDSYHIGCSAFSSHDLPGQTFPEGEVFITYKDGTIEILEWMGVASSVGGGTPELMRLAAEKFMIYGDGGEYSLIEVGNVKSITIYGQEFKI